jgi:hypothetical protein
MLMEDHPMFKLKAASIATALIVMATSFTPVQAFQIPTKATVQTAADAATTVQYRDRDRRDWRRDRDRRDFRRLPPRQGYYNGHRGYRDRRPGYRQHNGYWFPLAAFAAGAIIGGAAQAQPSYGNSHASWCANRWRSFRAYDNSYQPNYGPRRACVSPYR